MKIDKKDWSIQWVEVNNTSIPDELVSEQLVCILKNLVLKVKEDHARYGFKVDLPQYANGIMEIFNFTKKHGYEPSFIEKPKSESEAEKEREDESHKDIVDG